MLSRAGSYAHLREATDVTDPENRDLSAAVDRGMVDAGNALRFFDLEWLALPEDAGLGTGRRARARRRRPLSARGPPARAIHAHRARGAHARRARAGRRERLAGAVRPHHLDPADAVRRRPGARAAYDRPPARARARPRPRPAPPRARDALRRASSRRRRRSHRSTTRLSAIAWRSTSCAVTPTRWSAPICTTSSTAPSSSA